MSSFLPIQKFQVRFCLGNLQWERAGCFALLQFLLVLPSLSCLLLSWCWFFVATRAVVLWLSDTQMLVFSLGVLFVGLSRGVRHCPLSCSLIWGLSLATYGSPFPVSDLPRLPNFLLLGSPCLWGWTLPGWLKYVCPPWCPLLLGPVWYSRPPNSGREGWAQTFSHPALAAVLGALWVSATSQASDGQNVNVSCRQGQPPSKARVVVGNVSPCPTPTRMDRILQ